jgi:hypothetical protein
MKKSYTLKNLHQKKQAEDHNFANDIDGSLGSMKPKESTLRNILNYSKSLHAFTCHATGQKELMVMN